MLGVKLGLRCGWCVSALSIPLARPPHLWVLFLSQSNISVEDRGEGEMGRNVPGVFCMITVIFGLSIGGKAPVFYQINI